MKNKLMVILILLSILPLSLVIPLGVADYAPILTNRGFETGDFTGWNAMVGSTVSTAQKYEGTYSCAMWNVNAGANQTVYPFNKTWLGECSMWFASELGGSYMPNLGVIHDGGSVTTWSHPAFPAGYEWHKFDVTSNILADGGIEMIEGVIFLKGGGYYNLYADYATLTRQSATVTGDLENIDGGADWVFTDWKYYFFTLSVPNVFERLWGNLTEAAISFTVPTGSCGNVLCNFTSDSENWTVTTDLDSEDETRFGQPVILKAGSWSNNTVTDETEITFGIWFTTQILDVYDDPVDVAAYCTYNVTEYAYPTAGIDLFFIYSEGGFDRNFASSGNAGRLTGGEWCSMYGHNGSSVQSEIWFRNLQHIKLLPEIQFLVLDAYYMEFSLEYSIGEGEWLPGIRVRLHVDSIAYTGWLAGNNWINYTVTWYRGTGEPDQYVWMGSDEVYMCYHGTVTGAGDDGWHKFWVDLWFNSMNASSTIGGRVNAYEYPMHDNTDPWLRVLSTNWGVKDDVRKESMSMFNLNGSSQQLISSQEIRMVRAKVNLTVTDANGGQYCVLHPIDILDYTKSSELPLTGIQTPAFDETKLPTLANTGFLGFLWSALQGIGAWLGENVIFGGLNLWGNFVAFLDTIAGWLGAPGFFSNLFAWMGSGWQYLLSSVTYLFQLLLNFFLLLGSLMGSFVSILGELVLSLVATVNYFGDVMGGGIGAAGNLWDQLGIFQWITVAIIFYPIYLILLWEDQGLDAVMGQLNMIFGVASWLFNFFLDIATTVVMFISTIIESVPVAE